MWNRTKIQLLMWLFKILVYFPSLLYLETTTLIALKEERSARLAGATCWNIPPKKERKINFNNRRNTTEVCKCFCYLTVFLGCLYFITVSKHTAKMLQYQAQQRLLDKHAVATPKASTQKLAFLPPLVAKVSVASVNKCHILPICQQTQTGPVRGLFNVF